MRLSTCIFFPEIFLLIYFAHFLIGFFFWIVCALWLLWKLAPFQGSKYFLCFASCLLNLFIMFSNGVPKLWVHFLQKLMWIKKKNHNSSVCCYEKIKENRAGKANTKQWNCSTWGVSREESEGYCQSHCLWFH